MLKRDDRHVYFKDHVYVDENSMFDAIAYEQARMMEIFDALTCKKVKIDTSEENWEQYVQQILSVVELKYQPILPHPCDLRQYTGVYRWQNKAQADEWVITYDENKQCLYTTLFSYHDNRKSSHCHLRKELAKNGGFNLYPSTTSKVPTYWKPAGFGTLDGKNTQYKTEGASPCQPSMKSLIKTGQTALAAQHKPCSKAARPCCLKKNMQGRI